MIISLHDKVKVKLTDHGKEIYYHQYDELNDSFGRIVHEPSFPNVDDEGKSTFELWEFMYIYGEHLNATFSEIIQKKIIEPFEIEVVK